MQHAAEFRRCLIDLDVAGIRRLSQHVDPQYPQPQSDDEVLYTMHLARTKTKSLHPNLKAYSQEWLDERERRKIAKAVGVSVETFSSDPWRKRRASDIQDVMTDAVSRAHKAGLDLGGDAGEVRKRMFQARGKLLRMA